MKLADLTIGDWVRFPNNDILDQVICIDGLRNEIDGELCSHNYCNVADLQPIPLTAEILDKNGFKKKGIFGFVYNDGIHSESQVYVEIFLRWNGEVRVINILNHMKQYHNRSLPYGLFVHELQHALRLCGLNELANNFKI